MGGWVGGWGLRSVTESSDGEEGEGRRVGGWVGCH